MQLFRLKRAMRRAGQTMADLQCPYCDADQSVCHDDGAGYSECESHEMTCKACDKHFVFQTSISYYYEPFKADCLNGSEHRYAMTKTWPKHAARWRCQDCDHEKALTESEMAEHIKEPA